MTSIKQIISKISNDKRVALLGYYGSYANNTNETFSDIDLFIVLNGIDKLSIEGVHFQKNEFEEIDFLLISEKIVHASKIPTYITDCILGKSKIIYSNCEKCEFIINKLKTKNFTLKTSHQELENIYWHLRHIIFKAKRYKSDSNEMLILWSKFVYFLSLLWPRLYNQKVQGELVFLKSDYGKYLKDFLSISYDKTKQPCDWEIFLNSIEIFKKVKDQQIFIEIDNLIQPYTPFFNTPIDKSEFKDIISTWIADKL
ncbi:MAG: nucleotidyltransferase domain-containing protein [Flavobacteriaceae bacterium]|nr:nucleotidyltransferase domain-containing protein [Flavobacteriaceae bacterium]